MADEIKKVQCFMVKDTFFAVLFNNAVLGGTFCEFCDVMYCLP